MKDKDPILMLRGFFAYDLHNDNYAFKEKVNKVLISRITWIVLLCLFEWIFFLYHKRSVDFWSYSFLEGLVGAIGSVLIVVFLVRRPAVQDNKNFIFKGLKALMDKAGEISCGLYLWHGLVIVLLLNTKLIFKAPPYKTPATFLGAYLFTVIISSMASVVFHRIVEKPYQNLYN